MTFEGKVVAVTGAGGGIGTAIVSKFVDLGAKAVLLDVKEEFAKRTADLLHLTEENSMCLGVDVSKEEDVKEAVSKIDPLQKCPPKVSAGILTDCIIKNSKQKNPCQSQNRCLCHISRQFSNFLKHKYPHRFPHSRQNGT